MSNTNRRIHAHSNTNNMSTDISPEEEQATQTFLKEVNRTRIHRKQAPVPWPQAVKFLMARKFDVNRALELFESHEVLRNKERLDIFQPTEYHVRKELLSEKFTVLAQRDLNGAAIALFTARHHYPLSTDHQNTLQGLVFQLDTALASQETQRNGLVFVYDMTGSKFKNFDYDLSAKILNMLKGSYPARLKKVLIVTAPLWFKAPFKILRLFVKEKLRDRVYTVNLQELQTHISKDACPKQLGGLTELDHRAWLRYCLEVHGLSNQEEIDSFFKPLNKIYSRNLDASPDKLIMNGPVSEPDACLNSDFDSEHSSVDEKHIKETKEKETLPSEREKEVEVSKEKRTHPPPQSKTPDFSPPAQRKRVSENMSADSSPPPLPDKKRPTSPSPTEEESIHMPEDGGFEIEDFVEHVKRKGKNGLYKEYADIKMETPCGTFKCSKAKCNLPKNRYTDVLCFDHTRVKLSVQVNEPTSDYINANFVDGYKQKNAFISTQGPVPKTFPDFWRMVWDQEAYMVVMTTRTVERGRMKCGQYWPNEEDGSDNHGEFILHNRGIERLRDYIVTSLLLRNTITDEEREITHFQFVSWPDYGVPETAAAFLDFLFRIRGQQAAIRQDLADSWTGHTKGPPIVIHCSAGIGRTGTFITMDIMTKRLVDISTVDIETTVRRIRSQRAFSIQMPDQYVFCHLAIMEFAQREGLLGEVDLTGFEDSESESD